MIKARINEIFCVSLHLKIKQRHDKWIFELKYFIIFYMNDYIVSARKYRPMSFDSVVGQKALTTTLKNAVLSGKLAHAYLFCGPRGVGKTTCARIFAKVINCMHPTADGDACGECESCKAFNEQRSYNIFELDAASNNGVEQIKTLMDQTRIPPQVGKYKVFIIDEVHMLSQAAFNSFLKTLEEPPAHVIFILATTEKHKILPTILSRCQIYDFERMTVQGTINHLKMVAEKEGITYEEQALALIAEKADGGMRDALSIFDQAASFCQGNITYQKVIEDLNVLDADNYFNIVDYALENKVSEVMLLLDSVLAKGFDAANLVSGLASHIRNVLMAKNPETLKLLETSDTQRQKFEQQALKCNTPFLYNALKILNQCDVNYKQSSNKRLLVELTLIEVCQLTQPADEGASSGRSPKRLKTLFKKIMASRQQAAPQVAAADNTVVSRRSTTQQQPSIANAAQPAAQSQPSSAAQPLASQPKLKLSSLGITFSTLRNMGKKQTVAKEEEIITDTTANRQFSEDDLQLQWMMMCNRMPQQMRALASRMKNIQPKLLDFPNVEVVVENEVLLSDVQQIKGRIRATLAKELGNGNLTLTVRLAKAEEVKAILSKREVLAELIKTNSGVKRLIESLHLEMG